MALNKIELEGLPFNYPSDVVEEILKAFPAKSLLRFRSVCKHWRCLIDDPYFVNLHRLRSYRRRGGVKLLVGYKEKTSPEGQRLLFKLVDLDGNATRTVQSLKLPAGFPITQGVEGLLFDGCAVWNPTTRKRLHLPLPPENVAQVFNGVLGFDSQTGDYKVLQFWSESIRVLTVGTNSWKYLDIDLLPEEVLNENAKLCDSGVYAQNKIFFKVREAELMKGVLVFLVGEETFQFLPAPEGMDRSKKWFTIEFGNTVALTTDINRHFYSDSLKNEFEVWVLHDVGAQKWDQIKYGNRPMVFYGDPWSRSWVICSVDNTDEVLVKMRGCKNCYWDVKKKTTRNGPNLVWKSSADMYMYTKHVETLFDPTLTMEARR